MWNLFYRYPRLLLLTILCIIVSGLAAYSVLPRREDPPLTSRLALISTRFPGASAEHVEALVTTKIEEELLEIDAIAAINSTSRTGISVISVKLRDEVVDGEAVWSRLRDRLSDVTPTFPQGAIAPQFNEAIVMLVAFRHHPHARLGGPEAMHAVILDETRHMLSTSITTMVGFVPLLIDGGGFWPPLAIAIAGGVSGATLLGVSFAPAAYRLFMCRRVASPEAQTAAKVLVPV